MVLFRGFVLRVRSSGVQSFKGPKSTLKKSALLHPPTIRPAPGGDSGMNRESKGIVFTDCADLRIAEPSFTTSQVRKV